MPTYEYACAACGHEWEQTQRITEAPIETCPVCAASTAHRLISKGTGFILKGSGWYSDLYASPKPAAEKADGSTDKPDKKTEKPAETSTTSSEPAATPAAKPVAPEGGSPKPGSSSGSGASASSAASSVSST
jgi:putative FmdB family regulatory protein